ncbi:MAG: NAD(P)/FAD-dependent oxidoreductase [Rhizobiaceae bacterium]
MKYVSTIIVGAGQAGLAMSKHLTDRSIDHVLLERGEVANSWKTERWHSLKLLTPNWQSRLPDYSYSGPDPHGYMNMAEVVSYLQTYAHITCAPIQEQTSVISIERRFGRYVVKTNRGTWASTTLVLANGACNIARIPKFSAAVPSSIRQLSPLDYKAPDQLDEGAVLIVGASATGVQLAKEIQASGRDVTLSVGEHIRMPRSYRGRDIKWWMDAMGILDASYLEVENLARARNLSSLQLAGSDDGAMVDLNSLSEIGVNIAGRLSGMHEGNAQFSGSLANYCSLADLKMNRLLESIDQWVLNGQDSGLFPPAIEFSPTKVSYSAPLSLNLNSGQVKTIIWATGFRPDYSWLRVPVLDRKGNIKHQGGVVEAPGMYVLGLPFLRKRKSTLIDGVGDDAEQLSNHLKLSLDRVAA